MFHSLINPIKKTLILFLIAVTTSATLYSQEKASVPDVEKTYLHTDRSTYVLGESIWYKAYLVYAYNNLLYDHSRILYVELISPDSKIIARNKTKLTGGIGHGDFKLSGTMGVKKPGNYQIRAYTNWTRNFGDDFVFKKDIEIIDVFDTEKTANSDKLAQNTEATTNRETPIQTLEKGVDIQFFPEGGSLIENVLSVVAFKAVDKYGNPVQSQGQILDANGDLVTMFVSVHDGMGKFQFKPTKGMQYHAKIIDKNNKEIEVPLPEVSSQGYLLGYKQIRSQDILTIKTNPETLSQQPNASLTIRYSNRGILYFEETITLTNDVISLELPKTDLPEGISQITLYDSQQRPQSERLVYVKKAQDIKIDISTDKTTYGPKEQVEVNISSKNNVGEAVPASYSLACTDLNGVKNEKDFGTNISAYFLMESDIRGNVYNPGYYFDADNTRRFQHLDLLLLTQGWRDFLWKRLPRVKEYKPYKVEKGINITGRVKQLLGAKPVEGNTVSLVVFNKSIEPFTDITDNSGEFNFNDLSITGKARITLNTKSKRGNNKGMFDMVSIFNPPLEVDFTGKMTPDFSTERNVMSRNIYKKHVAFEVQPENILDEVEITGKRINSSENININKNLFQGYVVDEQTPPFSDIFDMLAYTIPSLDPNTRDLIRFRRNTEGALIVINQTRILDPADGGIFSYLSMILPADILKIEYEDSAAATMMFGSQARNGVVMIYTRTNTNFDDKPSRSDLSSIKQQIEGYYEARLFYAPNLDTSNSETDRSAAIRNTLFWSPYVHPDESGHAQLHYYNGAVETKVKVSLEGLTASGIPVVGKTYYTIQK